MSPEKEQRLFDTYPYLYRQRFRNSPTSLRMYGVECDDGWFNLICTLSRQIEDQARSEGLNPFSESWPKVSQVKEKFGSLRFYMFNVSEAIHEIKHKAYTDSTTICEVCGLPGTMVTMSMIKTVCAYHAVRLKDIDEQ